MTTLERPVRRKTRWTYSVLYTGESRAIVVSLEPGDVITFRELGRRASWSLPVDRMFRQAVRESTQAVRREKRSRKQVN